MPSIGNWRKERRKQSTSVEAAAARGRLALEIAVKSPLKANG
jgi:hypothetical protein